MIRVISRHSNPRRLQGGAERKREDREVLTACKRAEEDMEHKT